MQTYIIFILWMRGAIFILRKDVIGVGALQIYTVFNCVHFPLHSCCTVYIFYHIQSNVEITLKKTVNQFTIILLYLEQQLNVIHTVKLQWKVGHN